MRACESRRWVLAARGRTRSAAAFEHAVARCPFARRWIGLTSVSDAQPNLDGDDSWEEAFK